jgi:hypothetical protein
LSPIRKIRALPVEEIDVPVPAEEAAVAVAIEAGPALPMDLGPNAAQVRELLERAALLSAAERRHLGEVASWRWWPLTVPVGGASAGPRAVALLRARGAGRADAVRWIEARASEVPSGSARSREPLAVRALANAALAMLTRDVVSDDVFEALYGPWREVTHR